MQATQSLPFKKTHFLASGTSRADGGGGGVGGVLSALSAPRNKTLRTPQL